MNTIRELTANELDHVTGGTGCYCGCPAPTLANPGNLRNVGRAGEAPNGNPAFQENGPGTNGERGMGN